MQTKPEPLELEEFQIWLANPITERVLAHYRQRAEQEAQSTQERLFHSARHQSPQEWAEQQSQASYLKGHCDAFVEVAGVSFEDIEETE